MVVELFKCVDDIQSMEQSLLNDGLIGVSGGRVSVREKLGELMETVNFLRQEDEEDFLFLTYNHPETELGYAWDSARYTFEQAKSTVLRAYDTGTNV